jgi:type II secretory pathway pseudopilin PulG
VAAFSLIELVFVLGVAATLAAGAVPALLAGVDEVRTAGAARYVAGRLQQTRVRAVATSHDTALRVTRDTAGFVVVEYDDGNRNGILSADITSGADQQIGEAERVPDRFPGVEFGALPGVPGADGSAPPGDDPIRLGSSDRVTFTPLGTATPGSLYLRGRRTQFVVRIFGETGRTRIMKYHAATGSWLPL